MLQRRPVEPDLAAHRRPEPDEGAHQARLAGRARTDDAEALAGLQREGDVADDRLAAARRCRRRRLRAAACASAPARLIGSSSGGSARSISPSRASSAGRRRTPRQWAMASSIGASARAARMEAAIITPARGHVENDEPGADARARPTAGASAAPWRGRRSRRTRRPRLRWASEIKLVRPRSSAGRRRPPCPWTGWPRRCGARLRRGRCGRLAWPVASCSGLRDSELGQQGDQAQEAAPTSAMSPSQK